MCEETGKFRQEKLFFTMIVFFILVIARQSISSQCFNYGKTAFFISGTLGWNGSNTFQRKITTTKHGYFFFKNLQEQSTWQKIIMSSCNKTFKHVLSFFSFLTLALFILRITLYTDLKFSASFWISKSSRPEVFCKKCALRNFAKFKGKHLCQRLFSNKVSGQGPQLY